MLPEYLETNRARWDELVDINARSDFYDLAGFRAGRCSLLPIEREELGDVSGKSLLHLQCHFGMDTLSWARRGATVTGVDFTASAVALARSLGEELGLDARFVQANVYDLPDVLEGSFDIVYTSYGALCWLPDLARWARVVAHFLRPGGTFYIAEGHPIAGTLDEACGPDDLRITYPYLTHEAPLCFDDDGSYADREAHLENRRSFEWSHPLSEVVTALIGAGLRIQFLHEFPECAWQAVPHMVKGPDGYWRLPPGSPAIPFTYSIRAVRV